MSPLDLVVEKMKRSSFEMKTDIKLKEIVEKSKSTSTAATASQL
jgi:hypothetical protein